MSERGDTLSERLTGLRAAFDAAFALPVQAPAGARRGYLGIRVNDAPYALDLDEVASVRKHVPVTPFPSEEPLILGVAGFGGALTAVVDLAGVLGQPRGAEPVWFALVRNASVAFAFHALEGQLEVDAAAASAAATSDGDHESDLIWQAGLSRPVIRLRALVARVRGAGRERRIEGEGPR